MIVRTASNMRAHLEDFSGKLCSGLSKPARRFVSEARVIRHARRLTIRLAAEVGLDLVLSARRTILALARGPT